MKKDLYIRLSRLFNPIIILLYGLVCKHLADVVRYGGSRGRFLITLISIVLILAWFIYQFIKKWREPFSGYIELEPAKFNIKETIAKWWSYLSILTLVVMTILTIYSIYINFNDPKL